MGHFLRSLIPNRLTAWLAAIGYFTSLMTCSPLGLSQPAANEQAIQKIDASVASREDNLLGYTVTERYRVFRGEDNAHPAADMTVKTTYRQDTGKSYTILTQTGSGLLLNDVLGRVFDSERLMTQPANRVQALLNSANYAMSVKGDADADGRNCIEVAITPRRISPYLFKGSIWVDPADGSIVKLEGVAAKSPTILTGATRVTRHYEMLNGFPMATHATAVSDSWLLGQTRIEIDYTDYAMTLRSPAGAEWTATPPTAAAAPHE
jgi:hypothetical protein